MPSERSAVRVFVSYSHDDARHSERVLALAQALNHEGINTEIDQYHQHELIDWPRWCEEQLRPENSHFVLMICSAQYKQRVENRVQLDEGRGAFWEGALIYRELYTSKSNERFIPVLLNEEPEESLPAIISTWTHFRVRQFGISSDDPGYADLYRLLTDQPRVSKEKTGIIRIMSPIAQKAPTSRYEPEGEPGKVIRPAIAQKKQCKPFKLEVLVASPEAGYKFALFVERACSIENDPLWKLVFDLYKENAAGSWDQIIHVSFKAVDPKERQGVENMVDGGISVETATILTKEVHPAAKNLSDTPEPTSTQRKELHEALSRAAVSAVHV